MHCLSCKLPPPFHGIWKFLGQVSNPSRGCHLHYICSNAGSWWAIEPVPPQRQAGSLTHCTTVGTPWVVFLLLSYKGSLYILNASSLSGSDLLKFALILGFFTFFECFVCVCVCLFRAAPSAYGTFQTRSRIRAVAAGLCHSQCNLICDLYHSSGQCWILFF